MIEREPSRKEIGGRVILLGLSAYQVEAGKREKTTRCVEWEREAFTNKMEHCVHSGRSVRMQNRVKVRKRETEISLQLYPLWTFRSLQRAESGTAKTKGKKTFTFCLLSRLAMKWHNDNLGKIVGKSLGGLFF